MNQSNITASTIVAISIALLFTACQTTDPGTNTGEERSEAETSDSETKLSGPNQPDSGNSWDERMKQASKQAETSDQKVDVYVHAARKAMRNGKSEQAREELQKALSMQPGHDEASDLLRKVLVQLGELERGSGEQLLQKWDAVKEQQKHLTQLAFQEGKSAFEEGDYETAVNKFEEVMSRLRYMPVQSPDMKNLQDQNQQFLSDARSMLQEQEQKQKLRRQRAIQKMAEKEELERQQTRKERVQELLEQARQLFKEKKYAEVEQLLEEAKKIDPTVDQIEKLKRIAWRMRHRKTRRDIARRSKREFRETMRNVREKLVGQSKIVEFPSEEKWNEIKSREPKGIRRDEEQLEECEQEIINKLKNTQISIEFQETPLPSVLDFFRERVGINLIIDRQNVQSPSEVSISINLTQDQVSAYKGLQIVLGSENLAFDFRECTLLVTSQQAEKQIVFDMYQVKDLNFRLRDFPSPSFQLGSDGEDDGGGGLGAGGLGAGGEEEEEEAKTAFTGEQLVELIQQVVSPQTWQDPGAQVEVSNGLLLVRNTPEVHDQVLRLLENIRRSTGIIVTVEARFLEVRSTLLEQIGVEFADAGPTIGEFFGSGTTQALNAPFANTSPTQQTVGSGTSAQPVGTPTSGILGSNTSGSTSQNLQGHSSHGFGPIPSASFQSLSPSQLLADGAGGTLEFSILNDISVNAIINAVKQDSRSQQVVAPQLTLFNTQRGNVTVSRQIAYIKDVEPQTSTDSVAPDPEIGVVNDNGFILDVRPIVSADRRYITLELRPTITDLIDRTPDAPGPFEEFNVLIGATVGGAGGVTGIAVVPVESTIQVPTVERKTVRTTVAIPDGGTLMVGGVTSVTDSTRKSGVPVLSDIPVAGILGSQDENFEDRFRIIILVTGNITIMEEVEKRRFSTSVNLGN